VKLRERGLSPKVASLQSFGIPPFEQAVLIGNRSNMPSKATLSRFMGAIDRGAAAAIEHPAAAAQALAEEYAEPKKNAAKWRPGLEATLPLLSRSGHMDLEQAERLNDWMYGHKQFEIELPATEVLTNRYVEAGDGS
jgi:ABC-type nitrate/sulfonate/bicarbonate transport system substrate-binding protein